MIKLEHVRKTFPSGDETVIALDNISLEIPTGSFVSIVGSSGSGKSTLLHLIAGLDTPTEGTVTIGSVQLSGLSEKDLSHFRNRSIGFIFQQFMLLRDFSVLENVMLPHYIATGNKRHSIEKAKALLNRFHMLPKMGHYPHQISGGEAQRTAIARALINKPSFILADEPTGSLDEKNQNLVLQILQDLRSEYSFTLLLATHNMAFAKQAQFMLHLEFGHLKSFEQPPKMQ